MGSAGGEFPPDYSTTSGDPLRRVENAFIKNLTFVAPIFVFDFQSPIPVSYATSPSSRVLSFRSLCPLHLDLYVAVVFSHLVIITYIRTRTYMSLPLFMGGVGFRPMPPCILRISDSLVVVVFLPQCSAVDTYHPEYNKRTVLHKSADILIIKI